MNRPLTSQQQIVYEFIRDKIVTRGYGPTVREIGEHMNIRSPNGVMCHLRALERKGMIIRTANKSRAIELTEPISRSKQASIAISGTIQNTACHFRIEDRPPEFDFGVLCAGEDKFALQVSDDSLIEWSIRRGDLIVAQRAVMPRAGQLAIFRVRDHAMSDQALASAQVFRVLQCDADRFQLQSCHRIAPRPAGPPALHVDPHQCLGTILAIVRRFE